MIEPATLVEAFCKASEIQELPAGTTIFTQGDLGTVMYGLIEGEVELFLDGKLVETIHEGDAFGPGALVQEPPMRATTAIAKTPVKLAQIDRERFLFMVQETPFFALQLIHSFSNRLRQMKYQLK
jgi:CRP-like cAMP-binding protein